jgi:hypothetical protein
VRLLCIIACLFGCGGQEEPKAKSAAPQPLVGVAPEIAAGGAIDALAPPLRRAFDDFALMGTPAPGEWLEALAKTLGELGIADEAAARRAKWIREGTVAP